MREGPRRVVIGPGVGVVVRQENLALDAAVLGSRFVRQLEMPEYQRIDVVVVREPLGIVVGVESRLLPDHCCDEVVRTELLVEDDTHPVDFGVVKMNPDRAICRKQRSEYP